MPSAPRKLSWAERITGQLAPSGSMVQRPRVRSSYLRDALNSFLWSWTPVLREPRDEVAEAWDSVAAKVIDSTHSSGWVAGGIEAARTQMLGNGLALNLQPDPKIFGTPVAAEDWARDVETRFEQWANDPWSCDRGGRYTLGQLARQGVDQWFSTGEQVAVLHWVERIGSTHGTKVEVLPSTRLTRFASRFPDIVQGVDLDRDGAPRGYVFDNRRREGGVDRTEQVYVKARDRWGRPVVLHMMDGAPTAVRGISVLVAVLKVLRQYEQLADATLVAALIQAVFAASVESDASPTIELMKALQATEEQEDAPASDEAPLTPEAFDNYMEKRFDWYGSTKIDLGKYGRIIHMLTGEKLNFHRSEHPNTGYTDFSKGLLREVARCLGTTYEQFTGDYVGATYSSIRMGIADIWPITLYRRAVIPGRFYQGTLEAWLEEDIERGNTPFPGGVDAFLGQRQAACRAQWRGPPKPTADDLKTAKAQQVQRQEGWVPTEQLASEYGNDHRAAIESQARTNELRKANKLDPLPSASGGAPPGNRKDGQDPERDQNRKDAEGREARLVAALIADDEAAVGRILEDEYGHG